MTRPREIVNTFASIAALLVVLMGRLDPKPAWVADVTCGLWIALSLASMQREIHWIA
jgi:hypothetical protein